MSCAVDVEIALELCVSWLAETDTVRAGGVGVSQVVSAGIEAESGCVR